MDDIAQLRKSYERAELDEAASQADPTAQFELWLSQALAGALPEPNAMTLATVGADGRPSTRVVLIKGVDARGIVWYTNYNSRKGRELADTPFAALQFHWVELERVVRVEGRPSAPTVARVIAFGSGSAPARACDSQSSNWAVGSAWEAASSSSARSYDLRSWAMSSMNLSIRRRSRRDSCA